MSTPDPDVVRRLAKPGQIKSLVPGLPKRGRIKIGGRGAARKAQNGNTWYPPVKYDHFEIRQLARGTEQDTNYLRDEAVHALPDVGDHCTRLHVRVLYNDIDLNFSSKLGINRTVQVKNNKGALIEARRWWCGGDGEVALRMVTDKNGVWSGEMDQRTCPCELFDQGKCKPNGTLSVVIDGAPIGGVYEFRTTGKRSIAALLGSLMFVKELTGGQIAGIPLDLVLRFVDTTTPDGTATTVPVVTLEFNGSVAQLQDAGRKMLENRAYQENMTATQEMAREHKTTPVFGETEDEQQENGEEFYPDDKGGAQASAAGPKQDATPPAQPEQQTKADATIEDLFG
jgi:Recombination directionality factor-like